MPTPGPRALAALLVVVAAVTVVPAPGARALAGCVELDLSGFSSTPLRFELVGQGSMCFTVDGHGHFMPSVGSADASWSPQVQVSYDVTDNNHAARGGSVATSYDFTDTAPVKITVSGTPPAGNPGTIDAIVYDLTSTSGCTGAGDLGWGGAPQQVAFTSTQQVRCLSLDEARRGDAVQWLDDGSPFGWVVGADGFPAQDTRFGNILTCTQANHAACWLGEGGGWRFLVAPGGPAGTEDLTLHDFSSTAGCDRRIDGRLSFKDPPATFTRTTRAEDCITISSTEGVPLQLSHDGADNPDWNTSLSVYDADGRQFCGPYQVFPLSAATVRTPTCVTAGRAPYRVLTTGTPGNVVDLAARRLTDPVGCTTLTSTPLGFDEAAFDTIGVTQHPCFTFTGVGGDVLRLSAVDKSLGRHASIDVYNPDGSFLGVTHYYDDAGFKDFTLPQSGTYLGFLTVEAQFPRTHTTVSGECRNPLCGGVSLGIAAVSPAAIGAANGVTLHVTGAGLVEGTTFTLRQDEVAIAGTVASARSDGRSADVQFDLAGRLGSFDLTVAGTHGGDPVTEADAVLVQPARTPTVSMSLSARDSYVPERPQTVSVTVTNASNTDAFAVPITIGWLPPDSTITPVGPLIDPQVDPVTHQVSVEPGSWDGGVTNDAGEVGAALIVPTIPAHSTQVYSFRIAVTEPGGYDLTVGSGSCGAPSTDPNRTDPDETDCGAAVLSALVGFLPYSDCASNARNVFKNTVGVMSGWTRMSEIASIADVLLDGASCIADLIEPGASLQEKMARGALNLVGKGLAANDVYRNCFQVTTKHVVQVGSHDPNYVTGPGGGAAHATEARGLQHFELGFENSPTATAPAQEVVATAHLDPAVFDLATLQFDTVTFGPTAWSPAAGAQAVDAVIDPVRDDDLTVGLTASVDDATGDVTWRFLSRDPATLELPEDPALGFLPPDVDGQEGQGTVAFDVALREPASGSASVTGTVVFDTNDPVDPDPWSFVVDRDTPSAAVASPAESATRAIPVTFASSDPTAGSGEVTVSVSVDGADPVVWRSRAPGGRATYPGRPGHSYTFLAHTFDQAGHGSSVVGSRTRVLVLRNLARPRVKGTPRVGRTLRVAPGRWNIAGVRFTYRWLAHGRPIRPASSSSARSFTVTSKQRLTKMAVRVIAHAPGQQAVVLRIRVGRVRA